MESFRWPNVFALHARAILSFFLCQRYVLAAYIDMFQSHICVTVPRHLDADGFSFIEDFFFFLVFVSIKSPVCKDFGSKLLFVFFPSFKFPRSVYVRYLNGAVWFCVALAAALTSTSATCVFIVFISLK